MQPICFSVPDFAHFIKVDASSWFLRLRCDAQIWTRRAFVRPTSSTHNSLWMKHKSVVRWDVCGPLRRFVRNPRNLMSRPRNELRIKIDHHNTFVFLRHVQYRYLLISDCLHMSWCWSQSKPSYIHCLNAIYEGVCQRFVSIRLKNKIYSNIVPCYRHFRAGFRDQTSILELIMSRFETI